MQEDNFECWVDVPETDSRFQVSNRGHLRMLGRKKHRCNRTTVEMAVEPRQLVCDYKSGRLGWWLFFDNNKHFLARDAVMQLFPERFRDVDTSLDGRARTLRDETYLDQDALRERTNRKETSR